MRDEADGARGTSANRPSSANGSAPPFLTKTTSSNGIHTSGGGEGVNGSAYNNTNGSSASDSPVLQSSFYGHDREQVTRILIQGLSDLGYNGAATALSRESGFDLESPYASAFRIAVLEGDWPEAEALISAESAFGDGVRPRSDSGVGTSSLGGRAFGGLALSEDANRNEMLFLLRQQRFLEHLELREVGAALMVLRSELQPLHQDERQLHALSSLIMCQSSDDLRAQAHWDGAHGESRSLLLAELSRSISPSVMIPEHRLARLLTQIKRFQVLNCMYHNTAEWPSLYMNHTCEREDLPLDTILELDRHHDEVWFLRFSNDGTKLVTTSKDKTALIYDTSDFKVIFELIEHKKSVAYAAWSPDDSKLITCSQDHEARMWDTKTGKCLAILQHHNEPVTGAAWSPDGSIFATGSLDRRRPLAIWSSDATPSPQPLHAYTEDQCARVQDVAIAALQPSSFTHLPTPDGGSLVASPLRLVVICTDYTIHVFDHLRREKLFNLKMTDQLTCLSLSRDGREMLINLSCGEVWTLGVADGAIRQKYRGQRQGKFVIRSCYGGASEGFVVSGGEGAPGKEDAKISIWHRHSGRLIEQFSAHPDGCVNAVAWNPARPDMFASAGDDHKVRIYSKARTSAALSQGLPGLARASANPLQQESSASAPRWGASGRA